MAGYAVEEGKGLVVAVNKWDSVEDKTDRTFDQYVEWIRNDAPFLDFAPVVSIGAKTGQRVGRVLELAVDIWAERRKRVPTGELNRMLMAATDRTPPPLVRGKRPKLYYATQAAIAPPTFVFFASEASAVHFSYRRYLENRLRDTFGFHGTPIRLVFRDRASVKLPRRRKPRAVRRPGRRDARRRAVAGRDERPAPTVAVVGAGAWRPRWPRCLAKQEPVLLVTHRADVVEINDRHRNERRLPGIDLPEALVASSDPEVIRAATALLVIAVPSSHVRSVAAQVAPFVPPSADVLSVGKGLEKGSLLRMSEVIAEAAAIDPGGSRRCPGRTSRPGDRAGLPASAVVAAEDRRSRVVSPSGSDAEVPAVREPRHPRRRAVAAARSTPAARRMDGRVR